jgi:hypothetical protein
MMALRLDKEIPRGRARATRQFIDGRLFHGKKLSGKADVDKRNLRGITLTNTSIRQGQ